MSIMEKLAAQRAKIAAMKESLADEPVVETPAGWKATDRTKRGKPVFTVYAIYAKTPKRPNPIREAWKRLNLETVKVEAGSLCPRCKGTGYIQQFRHHGGGRCYWCNDPTTKGPGKGILDHKDKGYIAARIKAGTACDVVTV